VLSVRITLDMQEVTGSIPVSPTIFFKDLLNVSSQRCNCSPVFCWLNWSLQCLV
jgi:hypothetical protein